MMEVARHCGGGHLDVVKELLEAGADTELGPHIITGWDHLGNPLYRAGENKHLEVNAIHHSPL